MTFGWYRGMVKISTSTVNFIDVACSPSLLWKLPFVHVYLCFFVCAFVSDEYIRERWEPNMRSPKSTDINWKPNYVYYRMYYAPRAPYTPGEPLRDTNAIRPQKQRIQFVSHILHRPIARQHRQPSLAHSHTDSQAHGRREKKTGGRGNEGPQKKTRKKQKGREGGNKLYSFEKSVAFLLFCPVAYLLAF